MKVGVVSDTHNNLKNIEKIISLFNNANVELVIHTGDITSAKSLEKFSNLLCSLFGAYGNNDRHEEGLEKVAIKHNFNIQEPPHVFCKAGRNIAIFHEPDYIDTFLEDNEELDIVLHGHTHRYRKEQRNNTLIFNPGESAGMQKGKNAIGIINLIDLSAERIFF